MLAFTFDGYFRFAKNAELTLGVGLLVHLSHFGRRGDGIEDSPIRDARLGIVGDQLIAIGGDTLAGIRRHACLGRRGLFVRYDCHGCFWVFLPNVCCSSTSPAGPRAGPLRTKAKLLFKAAAEGDHEVARLDPATGQSNRKTVSNQPISGQERVRAESG